MRPIFVKIDSPGARLQAAKGSPLNTVQYKTYFFLTISKYSRILVQHNYIHITLPKQVMLQSPALM